MDTALPDYLFPHIPWEPSADPVWPATTFLLRRNLSKQLFPAKLKENAARLIEEQIKSALFSSSLLEDPRFLPAEALSALEKEFLFEQFICQESFQNCLAGQGFVVEKSSRLLALLNFQDHLHLHFVDCQKDLEKSLHSLFALEQALSKSLSFAFSPKFGYLTSDPSYCGTGLQVTAFLHLPALIHTEKLLDTLAKQNDECIEAFSLQGNLDEFLGDILVLRNRFTLGVTEENSLLSVHNAAMQLVVLEKALRARIKEDKESSLIDNVGRAFGLLMHSYHLQTKETLNALSLMKLGIQLGWISGVSDQTINKVFFQCRKAHLSYLSATPTIEPKELSKKRAELVRRELASMQLLGE